MGKEEGHEPSKRRVGKRFVNLLKKGEKDSVGPHFDHRQMQGDVGQESKGRVQP